MFVVALSLDRTVEIDSCEVTLVEANHCPGAVQFLFNVREDGGGECRKYVHTGDFRFSECMRLDPFLGRFFGADAVFLDTTYCNPRFSFVSQKESIDYIVDTVERIMAREEGSSSPVLFLISTYVLGKERIFLEVSRRLNCALHVDSRRMKILRASGLADSTTFTEDPRGSFIHVIGWNLLGETWPYFRPNFVKMNEIMTEKGYSRAVGFVPSGWMHQKNNRDFPVRVKEALEIHLVPYSEHSSYKELREYVRFLRPKKVIPTVGMDSSKDNSKHIHFVSKHFSDLLDETANKKELLEGFFHGVKDATKCDDHLLTGNDNNCDDNMEDQTTLSAEESEKNIEDLREFLPSWVSQEQLLCLLKDSNGDIVEAASLFVECETELYKEANAFARPSFSLESSPECPASSQEPKSTEKDNVTRSNSWLGLARDSTKDGKDVVNVEYPKKRGSPVDHWSKKKRKAPSTLQQSKHKQSTITKFFGKTVSLSSDVIDLTNEKASQVDSFFPEKSSQVDSANELNEFLDIISGALTPDAATALLNKTRWDINAALDLYYSVCVDVTPSKKMPLHNIQPTCITSSEKTSNVPSLDVKEISPEELSKDFVSLPLEKYSPVEHGLFFSELMF